MQEHIERESARKAELAANGGIPKHRTSECQRAARRRKAEREGRAFKDAEYRRRRREEKFARARQREAFACVIADWKRHPDVQHRLHQDYLATRRTVAKQKYWKAPEAARLRIVIRRHAHPDERAAIDARRGERQRVYADGSLTVEAMRHLFGAARRCPYCSDRFTKSRKSLDHVEPISKGGAHSIRNVVICCLDCNLRKGAQTFAEWIETLDQKHQQSARWMYVRRFGAPPEQAFIAFRWTA